MLQEMMIKGHSTGLQVLESSPSFTSWVQIMPQL